jgi:hypothetical protein
MKRYFWILSLSFFAGTSCSEYLGRKPPAIDYQLVELLLQYGAGGANGCGRFSLPPIRGGVDTTNINSNGTRQGFEIFACRDSNDLLRLGFQSNALEFTGRGVSGSSPSSRIGSNIDFVTLGGRKDQCIEVTFRIDRSDGYLQVIGNASVGSGANLVGPGVNLGTINSGGVFPFGTEQTSTFVPSPQPVLEGQEVTYCLEIHDEGGAHWFGWSKPCGTLTQNDRQNYEFDRSGIASAHPGNRIGFILNGATIQRFAVGERIGLSGSILWR